MKFMQTHLIGLCWRYFHIIERVSTIKLLYLAKCKLHFSKIRFFRRFSMFRGYFHFFYRSDHCVSVTPGNNEKKTVKILWFFILHHWFTGWIIIVRVPRDEKFSYNQYSKRDESATNRSSATERSKNALIFPNWSKGGRVMVKLLTWLDIVILDFSGQK